MRVSILIVYLMLGPTTGTTRPAQPMQLAAVISEAQEKSGVRVEQPARVQLLAAFRSLNEEQRSAVTSISTEDAATRLSAYFKAARTLGGGEAVNKEAIDTFSWIFITEPKTTYAKVSLPTWGEPMRVDAGSLSVSMTASEGSFLVPVVDGTFKIRTTDEVAGRKYTWSAEGLKGLDVVTFHNLVIRKALIHVQSKPRGAKIYFNNKKYHKKTDSSSSRTPGEWKIRLEKRGYGTWEKTVTAGPGEEKLVKARLKKKKP